MHDTMKAVKNELSLEEHAEATPKKLTRAMASAHVRQGRTHDDQTSGKREMGRQDRRRRRGARQQQHHDGTGRPTLGGRDDVVGWRQTRSADRDIGHTMEEDQARTRTGQLLLATRIQPSHDLRLVWNQKRSAPKASLGPSLLHRFTQASA